MSCSVEGADASTGIAGHAALNAMKYAAAAAAAAVTSTSGRYTDKKAPRYTRLNSSRMSLGITEHEIESTHNRPPELRQTVVFTTSSRRATSCGCEPRQGC